MASVTATATATNGESFLQLVLIHTRLDEQTKKTMMKITHTIVYTINFFHHRHRRLQQQQHLLRVKKPAFNRLRRLRRCRRRLRRMTWHAISPCVLRLLRLPSLVLLLTLHLEVWVAKCVCASRLRLRARHRVRTVVHGRGRGRGRGLSRRTLVVVVLQGLFPLLRNAREESMTRA